MLDSGAHIAVAKWERLKTDEGSYIETMRDIWTSVSTHFAFIVLS